MGQVVLWDEDTQVDFMLPGKALYIEGAEELLPNLAALTRYAHEHRLRILGSEDWHSLSDPEISLEPDRVATWPPHCMAGTEGQLRVRETRPRNPLYLESAPLPPDRLAERVKGHAGEIIFRKQTVDVFGQPNVEPVLDLLRPSAVVVYGVALDVCVRFAVDGFLRRGREELFLVTDATRAIDRAGGERLLEAWRSRNVRLVTTADVLAGAVTHERLSTA